MIVDGDTSSSAVANSRAIKWASPSSTSSEKQLIMAGLSIANELVPYFTIKKLLGVRHFIIKTSMRNSADLVAKQKWQRLPA